MIKQFITATAITIATLSIIVCSQQTTSIEELRHLPLDGLDDVVSLTGIELDNQISADDNSSLRICATESTHVRLFELNDVDAQGCRLFYRASLRTENLDGLAYLEMLCHFPGKGEFFSRDIQTPLTGTTDWTREEVYFFLREGENPDIVKLNLVVTGSGTVWVDDILLLRSPAG